MKYVFPVLALMLLAGPTNANHHYGRLSTFNTVGAVVPRTQVRVLATLTDGSFILHNGAVLDHTGTVLAPYGSVAVEDDTVVGTGTYGAAIADAVDDGTLGFASGGFVGRAFVGGGRRFVSRGVGVVPSRFGTGAVVRRAVVNRRGFAGRGVGRGAIRRGVGRSRGVIGRGVGRGVGRGAVGRGRGVGRGMVRGGMARGGVGRGRGGVGRGRMGVGRGRAIRGGGRGGAIRGGRGGGMRGR